ncbi:hypothetical protein [Ralstonia phage RSP15]|uniref:hypothetical protein n=1 Tax=Ralstonia phage RSP15 TaxID=1785960 RepID=UPI00074D36BD|nr:hypothetical protein BH754_gp111 [Ralstonia phage RSP15]BAU40195.1 hypothetical protein [Ralstonia phage RSP15]
MVEICGIKLRRFKPVLVAPNITKENMMTTQTNIDKLLSEVKEKIRLAAVNIDLYEREQALLFERKLADAAHHLYEAEQQILDYQYRQRIGLE